MSRATLCRVRNFSALRQWLLPRLAKIRCVSFDVFDTLLARCIEPPDDLQRRVAVLLAQRLGPAMSPDEVFRVRREAEHALRQAALADGQDHECHFDPLVDEWLRRLTGRVDAELVKFVHDTERELETCALAAKPGVREFLVWLRTHEVRVIAVSDMYLSHDHLMALLASCGLAELLDRVYVSSEFGLGKYSGRLHGKVLELEGYGPEELIHVGDNFTSDFLAPTRLGITGVFLDERDERLRRRRQALSAEMAERGGIWPGRRFFEIVEQRAAIRESRHREDFFFRYGEEVLGPVFCTFTLGLVERLASWRPDLVLFLARDGFIFQRLFESWRRLEAASAAKANHEPLNFKLDYAYASRRVVASASVADGLTFERAVLAFYNPKQHGLLSVLKTYGLPVDEFRGLAKQHGFPELDAPITNWRDPRLLAFLADERVQAIVRPFGQKSRQLLQRYFEEIGFFSGRRVALVDIGWNGTIQKFLHDSFGARSDYPKVKGYYFAFVAAMHGDCGLGDDIEGLVYDARRGDPYERAPLDFEEIFEQGARSGEATTLGYRDDGERVVPVLKSDQAPDRQAEMACNEMIAACQAGMLQHMEDFHAAARLTGYGFLDLKPYVLGVLDRAVAYPTTEEVENIGRLVHTEDFGHDHTLDISVARLTYLDFLRPRRLFRRLRGHPWLFAAFAPFSSRLPAWLFRRAYLRRQRGGSS